MALHENFKIIKNNLIYGDSIIPGSHKGVKSKDIRGKNLRIRARQSLPFFNSSSLDIKVQGWDNLPWSFSPYRCNIQVFRLV